MKLEKLAGATSEIWEVFVRDSSSTTGAGLTGLAFNTASLTAYYHRNTGTTATAITLVTMTVGTFTSSGFKEIDATNMPGWYQFCPPDAAIASGAKSCGFHLKGATNMAPLPIEVQLVSYNPDAALATPTNITAGTITTVTNLTNLPAITANWLTAAGTAADFGAELATAIWTDTTAGDFTAANSIGKSVMNGVALGTGLTINAYTGNTVQTGDSFARIGVNGAGLTNIDLPNQTMDIVGNITGNLSGSVGSVTGAVGSVTGAVGSVTGAVGSVTGNVGGLVVGTVAGVTPATAAQVAAILTTAVTESYRANGAAPTLAQFICEVLAHLGEAGIAGTTKTINKLDHTTPAETFTLDSAVTPTTITRAT